MSTLHLERQINALPNSPSKSVLFNAYRLYCRGYPTTFSLRALIIGVSYAAKGQTVDLNTLHDLTKIPSEKLHLEAS
jgi:hypothetical protein